MVKTIIFALFMALTTGALAQSNSFQTLRENFSDQKDVHAFSVNGFLVRGILTLAGEWECREALKNVSNIRLVVIPKQKFLDKNLSVHGFKKILNDDKFELLSELRDKGNNVFVYLQTTGNKKNRYFVLIDDQDSLAGIELRGYIAPDFILNPDQNLLIHH